MITVKDLNFSYSNTLLYNNINFNVYNNEHVVLVGPNGAGKTTLMKLIAKILTPDSGMISILPNTKVGYLDQYMNLDESLKVKDYLYDVFSDLFKKEADMNKLYEDIALINDPVLIERKLNYAASIQDFLLESDFYQIKSQISNVINGLGLDMTVLENKISHLSSGMRSKVILGKLLLEDNDLLLLDEPTNFLDISHIDWLTKFLNSYQKAYIVISHNEEFLRNIADVVLSIENMEVERYRGNYDFYLKERVVRTNLKKKTYASQQKLIKKEEAFINKNIHRASTSKRAKSRRKLLKRLVLAPKVYEELSYRFSFPISLETGRDVLTLKQLEIGYNSSLVEPLDLTIRKQEKVVITGKNGVGKSTLIKTILNIIPEISGTFNWDKNTKVSYLAQDDFYLSENTAFEEVGNSYPEFDRKEIYSLLATYGIDYEMANRPINTLSGGEQMKIKIALMKNKYANVLILDEPTNHLDVNAKKALKEALDNYLGTLILVSHDKEFYSDLCDYEITLY